MFVSAPSGAAESETSGIPVEVVYAPIRRLYDGVLTAVDVQLRGPAGSTLAAPRALREAARSMQETKALDTIKLSTGLVATEVPVLFTIDLDAPPATALPPTAHQVVTITHDAFSAHPAQALRAVTAARSDGRLVALDSVGSTPRSLALLPLLEPDIVILSPDLIHRRPDPDISRAVHGIASCAELRGAVIIADGVDSETQRRRAAAIGAAYGMGELYPPVSALPQLNSEACAPLAFPAGGDPNPPSRTPYEIVSEFRTPLRSAKQLLIEMSIGLESLAAGIGAEALCLGTFQHAANFTPKTASRWQNLGRRVAFAGVYGAGMGLFAEHGVHRAPLDPNDPLVDEWNVIVLSPHFACVLSALDLHRDGAERDREFDYIVTYDREVVARCARAVLERFD
ncbi:DICT sensory domain-containing protein [Hoyosella subflava]|uniref:Possible diguanylate cyclase/phosphodiesterase n=1 Tax=Hoyosella subflava (strain DSM 45089 / JCM 17490 / NBRC 109087 / DQS3-9A1) TaxID=443218 RepID=F6EM74_HOYSD|nr:DICT sensory domain-containing protein [Hoyosella subflava]AEF39280.1 Possible diguanylate cyclase/phosphodiesterase [Hoyosella subflava DQS3-9A1]